MNPLSKLALPPKLEPYRKEIEKTCKPYVHINTVINSPKLYESKFGGNPYLPLEANHPLDSQGKPMLLMAQINFSFAELIMKTPAICTDLTLITLRLKKTFASFFTKM